MLRPLHKGRGQGQGLRVGLGPSSFFAWDLIGKSNKKKKGHSPVLLFIALLRLLNFEEGQEPLNQSMMLRFGFRKGVLDRERALDRRPIKDPLGRLWNLFRDSVNHHLNTVCFSKCTHRES